MPSYHSTLSEIPSQNVCGCSLLPLKTNKRGPAPMLKKESDLDIVDEILAYFRANVLFTNFEIKHGADRVLVYGTLFTHYCLKKLDGKDLKSEADGLSFLLSIAGEHFSIPGDEDFVLGNMYSRPQSTQERELIRGYFKQLRECIVIRLVKMVFVDNAKSKWWMYFSKRKFMNKELTK